MRWESRRRRSVRCAWRIRSSGSSSDGRNRGILDVLLELNGDSRVNVELQIKMLALQVIELNKLLSGKDRMDDGIRLFNAKTKEELDMLEAKTKNRGILEAIKGVRVMSLGQRWKMMYDARMKQIRDQETLDRWLLIAAKIESIDSFREKAGI